MSAIVLGFRESMAAAGRLAEHLGIAAAPVEVHRFPDRECLVRVPISERTVVLYRSLDNPDAKLIELLFAASAARDLGAERVILVAPYLAYMRQDRAFRPGEAVSQQVIGRLLADQFDALVTVDPHLHRTSNLSEVAPGIPARVVSAAPALAALIDRKQHPLIVGPDSESRQWTESIAGPLGLDMLVGAKKRHSDRSISLTIGNAAIACGRPVVLVDDVVSSGKTLIEAARILLAAGAISVEAIVTHCLAAKADLARMTTSGIARISSSDSIDNPTGRVHLAPLLGEALQSQDVSVVSHRSCGSKSRRGDSPL